METVEEVPRNDTVYIKFKDHEGVFNCPLCEILDGTYVDDYTMQVGGKPKKYTKGMILELLQKKMDYGNIVDFAVQKKGEGAPASVVSLLEKYKIVA